MRPLFLEFKGLNSFSEKAQIDFVPLLNGGLFGIFGETGSGKSTILDAINFALFGNIGRSAVMIDKINTKCDRLEVKFTFDVINEGSRKKYYIERRINRGANTATHNAKLYILPDSGDNGGKCLADSVKTVNDMVEDIIGVSEEDFKKCIALPQGEFSQFVKSAPSERTDLIERLFSLQKYGENLKFKLSRRKAEKEGEFNLLTGKLSSYEGVTLDRLKELQAEVKELMQKEVLLKKQAEEDNARYLLLKQKLEDKNAYLAAQAALQKLMQEKDYYDKLGKLLPVLPDCAAAVAYSQELNSCNAQITRLKNDIQTYCIQLEKLAKRRQDIQQQIADSNYESEYARLTELFGKMSALLPDAERLDKKGKELAQCREKYKNRQKEIEKLTLMIAEKRKKLDIAAEKLKNIPEPDLLDYFGKQLKGGILKDEYGKNLCYIKDLLSDISFYADGSLLYEYITKELNKKAEEYKELILSVKDVSMDVEGQLKLFNDRLKEHREAENAVNACRSGLEIAVNNKSKAEENLADILAEGERLKREFDEISSKLAAVFGENTDYLAQTKKVKNQSDSLKQRQKQYEEALKAAEEEISAINLKIASAQQSVKSSEERMAVLEKSLQESIAKAWVAGIEDCKVIIAEYGNYSQALQKYNKYSSDYAAVESEVNKLKSKCNDVDVSADTLKLAEENKLRSEREYNEASHAIAVKDSEIKNFTLRLAEKKKLDEELKKVNADRDLIVQLDKLLRDNKFMKYIANEHLENISRTASATLLDLTDGRYFLRYVENNFSVGDNFNGGNLRRVNTLSGGETFLVSLSLALALSDTICKRSLKPMEFFFLDEGFGTLDGDLIDTVLNALEKLKSADFTIGLISHVEELKHRINNKILVSKATESHGSTVRISC